MTARGSYLACPDAYPRGKRASPRTYPMRRGGLPARLIAYFVSFGAGVEKSTPIVCEDNDIDAKRLDGAMVAALRRGIVRKRLVNGVNLWCVPAGAKKEQSDATDGA